MNRRKALTATAALMGTAIIGSQMFLSGCTTRTTNIQEFDPAVIKLLDDIAETILPETESSPGAGSSGVGEFIKVIVSDCYSLEERNIFFKGLSTLQGKAQETYGDPFTKLASKQKHDLLIFFDAEALTSEKQNAAPHFFTMLNQLTVWGYFSSKPGATQALRYVMNPGRYDGCVPYEPGGSAWFY